MKLLEEGQRELLKALEDLWLRTRPPKALKGQSGTPESFFDELMGERLRRRLPSPKERAVKKATCCPDVELRDIDGASLYVCDRHGMTFHPKWAYPRVRA